MSGHEQQHGKKGDNRFFPLKKGLGKIRVFERTTTSKAIQPNNNQQNSRIGKNTSVHCPHFIVSKAAAETLKSLKISDH